MEAETIDTEESRQQTPDSDPTRRALERARAELARVEDILEDVDAGRAAVEIARELEGADNAVIALARLCRETRDWVALDPPTREDAARDGQVIGRYRGTPVRVGFRTDRRDEDVPAWARPASGRLEAYRRYRTSTYDVHFRLVAASSVDGIGEVYVEPADE